MSERKLPVIYCPPQHLLSDSSFAYGFKTRKSESDVEYAPRPPTCKTCKYWNSVESGDEGEMFCDHLKGLIGPPQDGSGYCHLHPDAVKASSDNG